MGFPLAARAWRLYANAMTARFHPALTIEVMRGGIVESRHVAHVAVVDADGRVVEAWGYIDRPTFPRSANKPMQALPLVETGAADRFDLPPRLIAFACASHRGERFHSSAAAEWLGLIGLGAAALECGAHAPYDDATAADMIRRGEAPTALHNNCSGKHSGMLCHAVHMGEDPRGYVGHDHPTQRRVTDALRALYGLDPARAARGVDGCGIPTYAIPLRALALGAAKLADPGRAGRERATALRRIADAMAAHPEMVAGTGEFVTEAMRVAGAKAVIKSGAEGVFTGALRAHGFGFALKVEDGAGRAAELAAARTMDRFGAFDRAAQKALAPFLSPELRNRAGTTVGLLRADPDAAATF
jgi:L-asparaginase II